MTSQMNRFVVAMTALCLAGTCSVSLPAAPARLTVFPEKIGAIDDRIFGAFIEKAPPSERGPDSVTDSQGHLLPQVAEVLMSKYIPVIRFPGGYHVEESDWTEMIDNPLIKIEQKGADRRAMTLDAFLQTCRKIGSQPLLVVNLSDAFLERKPTAEAAMHAAAMVAYCNLPVGFEHPLAKWADLRAANGHPEPYGVSLWQIGNESFIFAGQKVRSEIGNPETVKRLVTATTAYIDAMRAVDPTIEVIADVEINRDLPEFIPALMDRAGAQIQYLSRHYYKPWGIKKTELNGLSVGPESLSHEEIWWAFTTPLATDSAGAIEPFSDPLHRDMVATGKKLAITEWNFNGGWWHHKGRGLPQTSLAKGLGAAAILHAMMRDGAHIRIANQSMLISESWDIGSLRVLPNRPSVQIALRPTGMVTFMYAAHHGDSLLRQKLEHVETRPQPLRIEYIYPNEVVAKIDAVTTARSGKLFLHMIHRSLDSSQPLEIDLSAFNGKISRLQLNVVTGDPMANESADNSPGERVNVLLPIPTDLIFTVQIPPHSVSVLEVDFAGSLTLP